MCTVKAMAETYEDNRQICKYVHSTSRGHEAIQLATAFHLQPCDFVSPYYRDESMLLEMRELRKNGQTHCNLRFAVTDAASVGSDAGSIRHGGGAILCTTISEPAVLQPGIYF